MRNYFCMFVVLSCASIIFSPVIRAAGSARLPYAAGESFVVTTGYDTPPMHINKDGYAIDFTEDGCDAYGKLAVAAFSGTAWVVEEKGYNGGYGTQLLVMSAENIVTRYAHMIPDSIPLNSGDAVPRGTVVGEIGDTGLVMGTACADHPGTHIHFAMDTEKSDGGFVAKNPEPISNYTGITAGKWYVSDNAIAATKGNVAALADILENFFGAPALPEGISLTAATSSDRQSASLGISTATESPDIPARLSVVPVAIPEASSAVHLPSDIINVASSSTSQTSSGVTGSPSGGGGSGGASISPSPAGGSSGVPTSSGGAVTAPETPSINDDPTDDSVGACQ
jgi:hypothetical protein